MTVSLFFQKQTFVEIIQNRIEICEANECVRLMFGKEDGFEGILVDKFGELIVVSIFNPLFFTNEDLILEILENTLNLRKILIRVKKEQSSEDSAGFFYVKSATLDFAEKFLAQEKGMTFEIRCQPENGFGIYLDACSVREKVHEISRGLHVLNLFSYTCAFGVAASLGGALSVTNVDPNKDYLSWGKVNAALNHTDFKVIPDTAQKFLERHLRRLDKGTGIRFDLIVLDPPAFGVGRGADRLLRLLWPQFLSAIKSIAPRYLIIMCNDKYFRTRKNFEEMLRTSLGDVFNFSQIPYFPATRILPGGNQADGFYLEPAAWLGSSTLI